MHSRFSRRKEVAVTVSEGAGVRGDTECEARIGRGWAHVTDQKTLCEMRSGR